MQKFLIPLKSLLAGQRRRKNKSGMQAVFLYFIEKVTCFFEIVS
jgi:hypothetical protein